MHKDQPGTASPAAPVLAAIPEGYKLVPITPTPEMSAAAVKATAEFRYNSTGMQGFTHEDAYRAMLAAAPVLPVLAATAEQTQAHVAPPFAAPAGQHQTSASVLTEAQILKALGTTTHEVPKRLPPGWLKFARAIEAEVLAAAQVPPVPAPTEQGDLEMRQQVAEALGLGRNAAASFAWSYLLDCIKASAHPEWQHAGRAAPTEQDDDTTLGFALMQHLGPAALAGGKMSPYDAFKLGWNAKGATDRNAVLDDAEEAAGILDSFIENVATDGPYGAESTLTFISQAKQCVDAVVRALKGAAS